MKWTFVIWAHCWWLNCYVINTFRREQERLLIHPCSPFPILTSFFILGMSQSTSLSTLTKIWPKTNVAETLLLINNWTSYCIFSTKYIIKGEWLFFFSSVISAFASNLRAGWIGWWCTACYACRFYSEFVKGLVELRLRNSCAQAWLVNGVLNRVQLLNFLKREKWMCQTMQLLIHLLKQLFL